MNRGLPPGPICTPQAETIDSVLNAPKTDYLYLLPVANLMAAVFLQPTIMII
jgi:UPF0755 protein